MITEEVSLASEMNSGTPSEKELEEQSNQLGETIPPPSFTITGCIHGLMSVEFARYYYPGRGPIIENTLFVWTFDLARKKAIKLWDEIDPSRMEPFSKFLKVLLAPRLEAMSRSTGEEPGESHPASTPPVEISNLDDVQIKVEEGRLKLGFVNYFDVSEFQAAMRGMEGREAWEEADPLVLRKFLKKNSILNAFATDR
jgi:hypothetical protein